MTAQCNIRSYLFNYTGSISRIVFKNILIAFQTSCDIINSSAMSVMFIILFVKINFFVTTNLANDFSFAW